MLTTEKVKAKVEVEGKGREQAVIWKTTGSFNQRSLRTAVSVINLAECPSENNSTREVK